MAKVAPRRDGQVGFVHHFKCKVPAAFHTQLFSGYGDSLVDFNRRRTVLSLGLSLVDF